MRGVLSVVLAAALAVGTAISATGAPATTPRRGGELVISMFEDADRLDPTFGGTAGGRQIFFNMCESLYDLSADGTIVPRLAAEMPRFSADGLQATIRLRRGVRFNDGTPFDAQAVKISLDRHRTLPGSRRAGELSAVTEVTVVDPLAVRLTLSRPLAPLVATLSDRAGMIMSPTQLERLGENFATNPVCVGPFSFVERVIGDRIVLERSRHYYDARTVYLDRVVFRPIPDENVRTLNLRSGDLHVVDRLAASDFAGVQRDERLRVQTVTSNGYVPISINIGNASGIGQPPGRVDSPMTNPLLREAFEWAIDRDRLNRFVFAGRQLPGCNPIAPVNAFYPKDLRCPGRNVARARELVQRAGVPTPITVELTVPNSPVMIRMGELIQAMTRDAGFALQVRPIEAATGLAANTAGRFQMSVTPWSGRVDPDGNLYAFHHSRGADNYGNAQDPEIDTLLDRQRTETSVEARKRLIAEIVEKIRARRNVIYLYHQNLFVAHSARVLGFEMYADGMPRLRGAGFAP
ncbi:MAG: ABC transporter substrate-binding protein [Armatimonadota bacterium]|nr:ABC transporter substrate-binding protein [Armatimonadota bacterium]MDR7422440.1 ABC transporter substrate-binding protein [Armatimonadota bacterium]MDR7457074.1 ABC transporter substrate-binding protein [Armatimonadota bacterium]MDR7496938.1 ABC transporter substrate-binding protein [Armatimonadota bacterium]MDR7512417.1 ABC transporter substrate-binding protein [Armatimonadota bacterium]